MRSADRKSGAYAIRNLGSLVALVMALFVSTVATNDGRLGMLLLLGAVFLLAPFALMASRRAARFRDANPWITPEKQNELKVRSNS